MAEKQTKKRASGGKSSAKSSGRSSGSRKSTSKSSRAKAKQQAPIRREVGAGVCLVLALCTVLGCFGVKGALLTLLISLFKGLIGSGLYILPFSFVMGFLILLLHDGRPVALRVTCSFLLAVTIGALVQLVGGQTGAEWSSSMLGELWDGGLDGSCGGVLAGLLAQTLELIISRVGAVIVLFAALALELITSLNMTVAGIITAIKNRPRPEYDEPKREHPDPAEVIVNHVAQKHIDHVEQQQERRRAKAAEFDLPVDEPPLPVQEAKPRKGKAAPMRPDVFVEESRREQRQAMQTETQSEGPDILAVRQEKSAPTQIDPQEQEHEQEALPKQLPPLNLDELRRDTPPLVVPNRAREESSAAEEISPEAERTQEEVEPAADVQPETLMPAPESAFIAAAGAANQALPKPEAAVRAIAQTLPPIVQEPDAKIKKEDVHLEAAAIAQEIASAPEPPVYQYPPISLLKQGSGTAHDGTEEMRQNAERLGDTLKSFGIKATIINVTRGPSVTRYEMELDRGVKLSKVTNLANDIALALGASGVRIAAIPEKISVVGIEVPNRVVSTVLARDVIDSPEFEKSKSRVSFAVGKDIGGNRIICDIGKLPHLLIAGTTGSGKSVCMNSLIISLLYKAKPEEVKLIMVDPKMVELGIYNGIPHLLIPVVTDPKKAAGALQWAVTEMMRRYRLMADEGVRDLASYNKQASATGEFETMPQIVVVIDELADLMLVAKKEVEESICRVAQMGRAAGMHLVIATQRPSADVITGLMKANIPSRIAFAVASAMESRIILDTDGAEKLVGKGDMLYAPLGQGKPKRVQGCFITDDEVQEVATFVKRSNTAEYSDEVMAEIDKKAAESGKGGKGASGAGPAADVPEDGGDEMLPAAVDVILETGQASVSMLQRRLKLGYARAARIMDEMEERGIVGHFEGSKPRQLLITKEQWQAMQSGQQMAIPEEDYNPPVEEEIP